MQRTIAIFVFTALMWIIEVIPTWTTSVVSMVLMLLTISNKGKFETDELTPTVAVRDDTILELFRGPTSAFKDVALSMLPVLMTAAREKCGVTDEILILTATSGDTGKAASRGGSIRRPPRWRDAGWCGGTVQE